MAQPIYVLIVEDNPYDARLMEHELRQAGYDPRVEVVASEAAFLEHLTPELDIILADYTLHQFDALRALTLLREKGLDVPCIIVSGTLSDERAVETLRQGAVDYLLKDRLARMGPAVRRAMQERHLLRERRRTDRALQRSESLNRAVLRSLVTHIAVLDAEGTIIMANEAWEAFSADVDETHFLNVPLGTNCRTRCLQCAEGGSLVALEVLHGIEAVLSGKQPLFSMEYPWPSDEKKRWFLMQATPLEDEQGGVVLLHEDITRIKQTDEALRESEGRWRSLVASHPEPILIVDESGEIAYINHAGAQIMGAASYELVLGQSMLRFIDPGFHDLFHGRLADVVQGHAADPVVYKLIRLDGEERDADASSIPILYNGRKAAQVVLRDVTERRRYEQGLIQAKEQAEDIARLRSTILTNISHEIRTPLTTILGFADVLADEVQGEHRMLIRLIQQGGRRLSRTLNSVLDLARLESGSLILRRERIDVIAEVTEIVTLFIPLAEERGIRLTVIPPTEPTWADVDVAVLGRIINNLVENALKFTEQGSITVSVQANLEHVRLQVQDTGVGIDDAFMPHLFEEFKQESTGLSRSYEGSGLGLSITRRLVYLAGGTIEVDSTKGKGTTFVVILPRYTFSQELSHRLHTPVPALPPPEPNIRMLLVEDNEEVQDLVRRMLEASCAIDAAPAAEAALALLVEHRYDIILLDIKLSGDADGTEMLRVLRARPGFEHLPVIALTAHALPGDRERFLRQGFDQYLCKPFTKQQLLEVISSAVEHV